MTTLQIEFNCLCLFVRDEPGKVVHVLMPETTGHHHAVHAPGPAAVHPAAGIEQHLARLVHESFADAPQGRPLEGWSLELGPAAGAAKLETLDRPAGSDQIVDVSTLTKDPRRKKGRAVARALTTRADPRVASRITLRAGEVTEVKAQAKWVFKGQTVRMAHRVVWEIDDVPDVLPWKPLVPREGSPLARLSDLGAPSALPGGKTGYRIRVFHTTEDGLPPNDDPGALSKEEVTHHFGVFYDVLGLPSPDEELLPKPVEGFDGDFVNCGIAQARRGG